MCEPMEDSGVRFQWAAVRLPCAKRTYNASVLARSSASRSGEIVGGESEGCAKPEAPQHRRCEATGSEEVACRSGEIEQEGSAVGQDDWDGQKTEERGQEIASNGKGRDDSTS